MPERRIYPTDYLNKIRAEKFKIGMGEYYNLIKQNQSVIGEGAECVVMEYQGNAKKVIAVDHYKISPTQAKHRYYSQQILETLFPYNFPHMHASFAGPYTNMLPGTIRHRIYSYQEGQSVIKRLITNIVNSKKWSKNSLKYSFSDVLNICNLLDIPFFPDLNHSENIIIDSEGDEYYVEPLYLIPVDKLNDKKILNYMHENYYPPNSISKMTRSLRRIKQFKLTWKELPFLPLGFRQQINDLS